MAAGDTGTLGRACGGREERRRGSSGVFFIFIFLENIFYRNIFSISQFTVLYPYRPAGGLPPGRGPAARQGGGKDLYVN